MKRVALLICLLLGAAAFGQDFGDQQLNSTQNAQNTYKAAMAQIGLDQKLGDTVEKNAQVFSEDGQKLTFGDLVGQRPIILLPMFYTCKSACGIEIDSLLKSLAEVKSMQVGKDYDVVLLSINPTETPEVARDKKALLLKDYGKTSGFHFLTGSYDEVNKICKSVGFRYVWRGETQQVYHPTGIIVLTKTGMITRYFYGAEYSSKLLETAIQGALRQQVGEKATPIMLGCIMVDPVTGARSLNIMRTLQVLGLLTLAVLMGSIAWMNYKHKHQETEGEARA